MTSGVGSNKYWEDLFAQKEAKHEKDHAKAFEDEPEAEVRHGVRFLLDKPTKEILMFVIDYLILKLAKIFYWK